MAQILVSGLVALVGLSAAFAAWRAAKATKASVNEMREARLQAVRPMLIGRLDEISKVTLVWERGKAPQIDRGERLFLKAPDPAHFVIKNVGMGTAISIETE